MDLEQMRLHIDQIFKRFEAQPALVGLQATDATIAGAIGLRLDLIMDNPLLQMHNPVIGIVFVNENYLKSFSDPEISFILAHECAHILRNHVLSKAFWTTLLATVVPVSPNPQWIAFDATDKNVYVTNEVSGFVSAIDTATNAVIATLPVGGPAVTSEPVGIGVDTDNGNIYIAKVGQFGSGTVTVYGR